MADEITVTATSVVKTSTTEKVANGYLGETVTAGQCVYLKSSDGLYYKAQCDGTTAEAAAVGIAMNGGAGGQPVEVSKGKITIGATVVVGTTYVVGAVAGGICPIGSLVSTNKVTILGVADTAATLVVKPNVTGVAVA